MLLKFISWNVNGLRAMIQKPHWNFFSECGADIIGFQETKATPEQLPEEIVNPEGWNSYWDSSVTKKGYSGVSVFTKPVPLKVTPELPEPAYRGEGRLLHVEYPQFHFFNGYFPNGGAEILDEDGKPTGNFKRLDYKLGFLNAFLDYASECRKTKPVVVCGDFNIAHEAIDLANPVRNARMTGFLPIEREWMDRFVEAGFIDTFRFVRGNETDRYTWWSYQSRARAKNIGWRIDYFFVSGELQDNIREAWIFDNIQGSDHCPVGLALEI